jgi:putative mRNA 3-end processing factor
VADLLRVDACGLYCEAGDFHIDPWRPVGRAVITHAHSDHARRGSGSYLTALSGEVLLRERLGADATILGVPYGEPVTLHGTRVSLHPAGHLLGSAQVRVERGGEVWVASGDYKLQADPTCEPFEPVKCHVFFTESTYGLPVYRWPDPQRVFAEINAWWAANRDSGRTSVMFGYALGKVQRLLAGLDPSIGPILAHGAVLRLLPGYLASGVRLPEVHRADPHWIQAARGQGLVLAPPSAMGTPWLRRFGAISTAFASGWMRIRGARRWRSLDRGFVLSDHADWDGLLTAVKESGAQRIGVTHGFAAAFARWLREQGWDAWAVPARFEAEDEDEGEVPLPAAAGPGGAGGPGPGD